MVAQNKAKKRAHRSTQPPGPSQPGSGGDQTIGVRMEKLDPRIITWPDGRITSEYDEERAVALQRSMAELGQQDAVGVVALEDGTYEGAAGKNRCEAAIQNGVETILCVIRAGTHRDVVKSNLATSINQSRANPLSEVEGIAHAANNEGFGTEELVLLTGMSVGWIADRLLISEASPAVKQCLGDRRINMGTAALLAGVIDLAAQEEALRLQLSHGWTLKQLNDYLLGVTPEPRTPTGRAAPGPLECHYCHVEHPRSAVQQINVCNGCTGEQVMVSVELLRNMAPVLAGSQEGAPMAERIELLVEGIERQTVESE